METLSPQATDPVSSVLAQVQVRSTIYCLSELAAPWGFRVEGRNVAKFHLVLEGEGELQIDGTEPLELAAGDLVLLPHGHAHAMRDQPDSPVQSLDRILIDHPVDDRARMSYGGNGPICRLLCGGFGLEALPDPLRPLLPTVIALDSQAARVAPWLEPIFQLLRAEADDGAPGAKAVFAKIADVFLTQALRSFLIGIEDAGLAGMEPLLDPQIATAIELIHNDPTHPWTVAELASCVHMSRSAFNDRFRELVGEPPIQYVTRVRLSRAASYLATSDKTIFEIARLSGYTNDAALSKAFKRSFGLNPSDYRDQARHHPLLTATQAA